MEAERELTQTELNRVSIEVQNELNSFQSMKIEDLKSLLIAFTKLQIKYYQTVSRYHKRRKLLKTHLTQT